VDANTLANNEFNAIVYGICGFPFTPVLDGEFFPESPRRALARKNYKMANILLGTNKDEGNYFNIYYLSNILKKEVIFKSTFFIFRKKFHLIELNLNNRCLN
jgi:acetylcholinesterase